MKGHKWEGERERSTKWRFRTAIGVWSSVTFKQNNGQLYLHDLAEHCSLWVPPPQRFSSAPLQALEGLNWRATTVTVASRSLGAAVCVCGLVSISNVEILQIACVIIYTQEGPL